jgi:nitroimidazol reductase NimA-like FMN-containing flavoprotein (pyridoxamine 5'-phosphate oxidase superfamily)
MDRDPTTLTAPDEETCRTLLATVQRGRIALSERALPMIVPVRFACLDRDLVFPIDDPSLGRAGIGNHVVCFEADLTDADDSTGGVPIVAWTVAVIGRLTVVTEPAHLERCRALQLTTARDLSGEFLLMAPEVFQGRVRPH